MAEKINYLTQEYADSPERDVLTPAGVQTLLNIGEKQLRVRMNETDPQRQLPHRSFGNSHRFSRARILKWMEENDPQEDQQQDS